MARRESDRADGVAQQSIFATTHWSVVLAAGALDSDSSEAKGALEGLCSTYWYPIYAFVRRQGHSPPDAQDLTQEFFGELLEKKHLQSLTQPQGKFRSFLLKLLQHFLANEWRKGHAQKRGGGCVPLSFDGVEPENGTSLNRSMPPLRSLLPNGTGHLR